MPGPHPPLPPGVRGTSVRSAVLRRVLEQLRAPCPPDVDCSQGVRLSLSPRPLTPISAKCPLPTSLPTWALSSWGMGVWCSPAGPEPGPSKPSDSRSS